MKYGKRQLILASLVLALGAAVYLNWQFSDTGVDTDVLMTVCVRPGTAVGFPIGHPNSHNGHLWHPSCDINPVRRRCRAYWCS